MVRGERHGTAEIRVVASPLCLPGPRLQRGQRRPAVVYSNLVRTSGGAAASRGFGPILAVSPHGQKPTRAGILDKNSWRKGGPWLVISRSRTPLARQIAVVGRQTPASSPFFGHVYSRAMFQRPGEGQRPPRAALQVAVSPVTVAPLDAAPRSRRPPTTEAQPPH